MIFSLGPLQHQTPPYAGTHATQTFSCNVSQHPLCPLSAGHVHIVEQPITFFEIVLFVPMPYQHLLMGTDKPIIISNSSLGQHTVTGGAPNFRQSTCHAFNCSVCRHQTCQFLHQCKLCGTNHSAKNCPNRGSSTNSVTQTLDPHTIIYP